MYVCCMYALYVYGLYYLITTSTLLSTISNVDSHLACAMYTRSAAFLYIIEVSQFLSVDCTLYKAYGSSTPPTCHVPCDQYCTDSDKKL